MTAYISCATLNIINTVNTDGFGLKMKQSVYLQIKEDIIRKIELGLLRENERLPSCREKALTLGINPNTVQRAYSELEESGYIFTIPKKGVYVSPRSKRSTAELIAKQKLEEMKSAGLTRKQLDKILDEIYGDKYD